MLITTLSLRPTSNEDRCETSNFLADRRYVYNPTFTKACRKYSMPRCIVCDETKLDEESGIVAKNRMGSAWKIVSWLIATRSDKGCTLGEISIVRRTYIPEKRDLWTIECHDDEDAPTIYWVDMIDIAQLRDRIRVLTIKRQQLQVLQFMLAGGGILPAGSKVVEDKTFKKGKQS